MLTKGSLMFPNPVSNSKDLAIAPKPLPPLSQTYFPGFLLPLCHLSIPTYSVPEMLLYIHSSDSTSPQVIEKIKSLNQSTAPNTQ